jgi:hypothetical protein
LLTRSQTSLSNHELADLGTVAVIQLEMTHDELLALPVSVDLLTAGRAFGLGRTKAFELARAGSFPCRVLRVGKKFRVPRSAIFDALGISPSAEQTRSDGLPTA